MEKIHSQATNLVLAAVSCVRSSGNSKPWDYGWCVESYRRSKQASISSPDGPVSLSAGGVTKIEELHELLAKQSQLRDRWSLEELWGYLATLVSAVSTMSEKESKARGFLARIIYTEPSLVIFPVSNIAWEGTPLRIGKKSVIGVLDSAFMEAVQQLGGRAQAHKDRVETYISQLRHRNPRVGFAALVPGQRGLARSQAERNLQLVVDLTMMLVTNKSGRNLWSLRGDTNRPGVRGITLDRKAVEAGLRESGDDVELYSNPLVIDALGQKGGIQWLGEEPIPLRDLLQEDALRSAVERCLTKENGFLRRLHVAARWFAESYWSSTQDDAALAAGVALDALLGSKSALPGRAMKERYALLEEDRKARSQRAKQYEDMYSVRSIVAHGGEPRKLSEGNFLRDMQDSITWAAWRLLEVNSTFSISNEKELESLLEDLRWGTREWPSSEAPKPVPRNDP
ncbi:hypothetical protein HCC61_26475 [Streptomyces sp. HNM0575]|uniref:HEPN domain-containing protein n=1 Tax=Streptomyces sp. HNM0575 TaxID=2716338 RepID=UPI00145E85DB|nr:HEPN domain-containing protein [Streptomyces sp. HNM0575]NLU76148.1 hypothetical protein [Streptomyces sp. HNM0575]